MIRRILITLLVFVSITSAVHASDTDWQVHIKVSVPESRGADGTIWNHLIAGVRDGATDGFDSEWDTLAMVETDDPVQSMFMHGIIPKDNDNDGMIENWTCDNPDPGYGRYHCGLWRDMKSFGATRVWRFIVLSTGNGGNVTLDWSFDGKPEKLGITLVDLTAEATSIDMLNSKLYSYTNNFESGKKYGIHYFELRMEVNGFFILPVTLHDATAGTIYKEKISASVGTPWWSIEDEESVPWINIGMFTGEITGIPADAGTYEFTVRGDEHALGYSLSQGYTINVNPMPEIDTVSLPAGVAGGPYNTAVSVAGGSKPFYWGITGNMPEGVSIDHEKGIISGTPVVPGIYDFKITVKDVNGASDSVTMRITVVEPSDVTPPEAINDLRIAYLTDSSAILIWTAPADNSRTGTAAMYDLRYMEDCSGPSVFDWERTVNADSEPRPQAGVIHTYTLTGLLPGMPYCIAVRSMDAGGYISPLSNIAMVPASAQDGMFKVKESVTSMILRKGYNLISFPLMPVPNGRNFLSPALGDNAALYRWYSYYAGITPPQYYEEDFIIPGFGYLLYSAEDNIKVNINGVLLDVADYEVALQEGWNMIGTPHNKQVMLHDLTVKNRSTGELKAYTGAVKSGWIGNTIYNLNAANYDFASFSDDPPASLEPWVGYWIYVGAEQGVNVMFRRP